MSGKHEAERSEHYCKWGHHIQNLIPSLDKRLACWMFFSNGMAHLQKGFPSKINCGLQILSVVCPARTLVSSAHHFWLIMEYLPSSNGKSFYKIDWNDTVGVFLSSFIIKNQTDPFGLQVGSPALFFWYDHQQPPCSTFWNLKMIIIDLWERIWTGNRLRPKKKLFDWHNIEKKWGKLVGFNVFFLNLFIYLFFFKVCVSHTRTHIRHTYKIKWYKCTSSHFL